MDNCNFCKEFTFDTRLWISPAGDMFIACDECDPNNYSEKELYDIARKEEKHLFDLMIEESIENS